MPRRVSPSTLFYRASNAETRGSLLLRAVFHVKGSYTLVMAIDSLGTGKAGPKNHHHHYTLHIPLGSSLRHGRVVHPSLKRVRSSRVGSTQRTKWRRKPHRLSRRRSTGRRSHRSQLAPVWATAGGWQRPFGCWQGIPTSSLPHISLTLAVSANTGLADKQAVAPHPILYLPVQQKEFARKLSGHSNDASRA
jgi:hypothetical protein